MFLKLAKPHLLKQLVACYLAFRIAWAQPAFRSIGDSHFIDPNFHPSQEGPCQVFNFRDLLNRKRPSEDQPIRSQPISSSDQRHWTGTGARESPQEVNLDQRNEIPDVAKRQKTVEGGHHGSTISQSNRGRPSPSTDAIHDEIFQPSGLQGPQIHQVGNDSYQPASFSSAPASLLPSLSHDISQRSLIDLEGEHLNSQTPESMFESFSSHGLGTNDDDHDLSWLFEQLRSPQVENIDTQRWSSISNEAHGPPSLAVPELMTRRGHVRLQHDSPSQDDVYNQVHHHQLEDHADKRESHTALDSGHFAPDSRAHSLSDFSEESNGYPTTSSEDPTDEAQDSKHNNKNEDKKLRARSKYTVEEGYRAVPLRRLFFPRKTMDDEFLGRFSKKFSDYLSGMFQVKSVAVQNDAYQVGESCLVMAKNKQLGGYVIRILLDPKIAERTKYGRSPQRSEKFSVQFTKLIRWLLFTNTVVLRRFDRQEAMGEDEFTSHNALIDWLFKEAFHPDHCFPILGTTPNINKFKKGEESGELQKILIGFLSQDLRSKPELKTCLSIIRLYYENFKPEIVDWLGYRDENEFNWKVRSLISNGIESKIVVGRGVDLAEEFLQLGNFEICKLDRFPNSMKPCRHAIKNVAILGAEEQMILDHFDRSFSMNNQPISHYKKQYFGRLPAVLLTDKNKETKISNGFVWVKSRTGSFPRKRIIFSTIHSLLGYLNVCHTKFLQYVGAMEVEVKIDLRRSFIQWIHDILIKPGENTLPLLGDFVLEHPRYLHSLTSYKFHEVQIFLMSYFSDSKSHLRVFQVCLSLIGYWYSNHQTYIFLQLFRDDKDYWDIMIKIFHEY
ncbi:hypothetical protein Pst134EB_022261 [Puccinia striiformis f. sp. tritici]|uniref:Uncharacterized protein n=2 Tax=Puccinia striiformis TaxID=27350 RepID=A0A0L0UWT8_9BASI|nr:hypothetical protein Pst134EB_022261 [Puccinia striiformis f. sp. tritici]KNE91475.1 hypothetical protein PSTG_15106 [Puccinia striiformis f. sp. tritici PST-78]